MSNHHVVLHVDIEQAKNESTDESITRCHLLFSSNLLSQHYKMGVALGTEERTAKDENIITWRER